MGSKYRFSWAAFDDQTVKAIATANGYSSYADTDPCTWLSERCKRPNEQFVRDMKSTLEQYWLPNYPGTPQIVEHLLDAGIGPMGNPKTQTGCVNYVRKCRNSKTVRLLLLEALLRYGDQDPDSKKFLPEAGRLVPRFAILDRTKQTLDSRKPYDYQEDAWNQLSAHLAEAESTGIFQGLLVMPTGAGKTFTSARWLMENVVNRGYRLVWIAHRYELLEQAAKEFHGLAALATRIEKLRVRIVSGIHCVTSQIDPADHILIASVSSLTRRPDLIEGILADPKTFLVIDEAHHSTAKSYTTLINFLGTGDRRILGLTATPTRTSEKERGTLAALFGNRILYQVPIQTLIERQFLSRPIPVRVATHSDVEAEVSEKDEKYLAQFNDLSEEWLERIAKLEERNHLIISHYLENQKKYGKTLIFAISVLHAALLTDRLREKGIKAEYIASYRWDEEEKDVNNQDIIHRFRNDDSEAPIDVLVNVQILTEGVDIPNIQTVFLTRPTISEILVRQMIGRALRGEKAGGTKEAYIVSFEDHWERFREWQSPLDLVPDIVPLEDGPDEIDGDGEETLPKPDDDLIDWLPWDLIRTVASQMSAQGRGFEADAFEAIPNGWYVLSREVDGEDVYQVISVYEHQKPSWEALLDHLWTFDSSDVDSVQVDEVFDEFFYDCDHPQPSEHDIRKVIAHWQVGGDRPQYNALAERGVCDPYHIAQHIVDGDLGARAQNTLLEERYTKLAKAIYPSLRDFRAAIDDAVYELLNPDKATRSHRAIPVFDPRPEDMLEPGPYHDLEQLMTEVLEQAPKLLGVQSLPTYQPIVEWTRRLVKGWYGVAQWEDGQPNGGGKIRINLLLDSPNVDADVVRYLLWHEYLHLYLQQGHTETFREYECRWCTYRECDRFLDTLNEKFGIQYW